MKKIIGLALAFWLIAAPTQARRFGNITLIGTLDATGGIGLLPSTTDCSGVTAEGSICWDTDGDNLYVGDGAAAQQMNAAASGDSVTVDGAAIDTTANFKDNTEIAFTPTDGGPGGPDDIAADIVDDTLDFTELADALTIDASTTVAFGANDLIFNIANPGSNAFELNGTGAFSADLLHIHQHTGNPSGGNLLHAEAEDADVSPLIHIESLAPDTTASDVVSLLIDTDVDDDTDFIPLEIRDDNGANNDLLIQIDSVGRIFTRTGLDAVGAVDIDIGSADVTLVTIITDGTGDGEIVLPNDSIGLAELTAGIIRLPVQSAKITGGCVTNGDATQGAQIEGGEDSWALLFDATTDESACWDFVMPETYNTTTMTIELTYSMASGTANEVQWEGAWACHSEGEDLDTIGFDTLKEFSADTVEDNAGEISKITQTFTSAEADGVVKGDHCQFQLSTDADDGTNDDATGDRELRAEVLIRW